MPHARLLTVSEAYFAERMLPHEAALVDIAIHAIDVPLARILPHDEVAVVGKYGFTLGILGYHQLIVVNLALEIVVVEIGESVE